MRAEMWRTMQAAGRVQVFNQAHPIDDPGLKPVIEHFNQGVVRATGLVGQQTENRERSKAARRARETVRRRLADGLLPLFTDFFRSATDQVPALRGFRAPGRHAPDPAFLITGGRIIEEARTHLEILAPFGLTPVLVDEAAALLEQFRTIAEEAKTAVQTRVQASKALEAAKGEITGALHRLDRLNRHRFADQPEILARWDTARQVVGRTPRTKEEAAPSEPTTPEAGGSGKATA